MSNANFIDFIKINCRSGNGGSGSSHFRREKFVPLGGPDGGDGGKGGDIILKGNSQLWTLLHLRYTKHLIAENGENGSGSKKHGRDGKDIIINVPLGTVAKSVDDNNIILEIIKEGEEKINNRINVYKNETLPVLNHYKNQNKYHSIDGHGTIENIFDSICSKIDN